MSAGLLVAGQCVDPSMAYTLAMSQVPPQMTTDGTNVQFVIWDAATDQFQVFQNGVLAFTFPGSPMTFTACDTSTMPGGLPTDFDYTILGALFAFSFSVVAALYFIGKSGGAIINIFRPR